MSIQRFTSQSTADEVAAALAADGVAIVERAVPDSVIDEVLGQMEPHVAATPTGVDDFMGRNTRRTGSLLTRSEASHRLVMHPLVIGACDQVLGNNATTYQLHLTQVIDVGPGSARQMLHRDQWAWDFYPFPVGFEVEVSTIWAGVDFTETNGATRVIPGSHLWEAERRGTDDETFPAEMPKGSVVLYTGSLIHGAGENASDARRVGVNIDYCLGWLRQEENQYLSCPPDEARALPVELAKLAGYSRAATALGYYGDTLDPMEAVHPGTTAGHGF